MHSLTLNISKCSFLKPSIDYLGREISIDGVKPGQRKVEAVMQMPEPTTVKGIRQFLGLSGYFRKFIQGSATVLSPLIVLTRKNIPWTWGTKQKEAVEKIKQALISRPILAIFDGTLRTELHTDASSLGVGAILFQFTSEGTPQVVTYFSCLFQQADHPRPTAIPLLRIRDNGCGICFETFSGVLVRITIYGRN